MANAFSKEEIVFFDQVLAGFNPNNITAKQVSKFKPASTEFERSALTVHRPLPYISTNVDGLTLDAADFADITQLTVPSSLNANASAPSDIKNIPFQMNAVELNDPQQRDRKAQSAVQKLSALVDTLIARKIGLEGTLFVRNPVSATAITNYSDVVKAEEVMTLRDVPIMDPRTLIMNAVDWNNISSNLANRDAPPTGVSLTAFERSMIPTIATFDSFKANFTPSLVAAAGASYLIDGNQKHIPQATDVNGNNVDNRSMELDIDTGTGVIKVGDAFTIAGINALSLINKEDTQQLQTFRVLAIVSGGGVGTTTLQISPAIVTNNLSASPTPTQPELEYANCSDEANDGAAIVFINTVTARTNIFFHNQSVEIVHGSLATMDLNNAGVQTMRRATDSGIEILFAKGSEIRTLGTEYRLTMWVNPNILNPMMCGVIVGDQTF